jgi:hypothetical protein
VRVCVNCGVPMRKHECIDCCVYVFAWDVSWSNALEINEKGNKFALVLHVVPVHMASDSVLIFIQIVLM